VSSPAPGAAAPAVELRGIRKSYGDLLVNDGVGRTPRAGGGPPPHRGNRARHTTQTGIHNGPAPPGRGG
jgi:hypothetical protein